MEAGIVSASFFVSFAQITLITYIKLLVLFERFTDNQPNWSHAFWGYMVLKVVKVGDLERSL